MPLASPRASGNPRRPSAERNKRCSTARRKRSCARPRRSCAGSRQLERAARLERAKAAHLQAVEQVKQAQRTGKGAAAADLAWREAKAELLELETGQRPAWAPRPAEPTDPAETQSSESSDDLTAPPAAEESLTAVFIAGSASASLSPRADVKCGLGVRFAFASRRRQLRARRPLRFRLAPLEQPPVGRPRGELVAIGELQLAQHRRDVGLDGLHRDMDAGAPLPCRCSRERSAEAPLARAASAGPCRDPRSRGADPANASSTNPARRGENTASPA